MDEPASLPAAVPPSHDAPMAFRFGSGWRGVRLAAISQNLLSMVDRDGTLLALKFVPDRIDPSRASIVYVHGEAPETVVFAGPVGPVWAHFDVAVDRFRRKAFPDAVRRWTALAIVLGGVLLGMLGTWAAVSVRQAAALRLQQDVVDTQDRKWEL
jgi:hypothetical protein